MYFQSMIKIVLMCVFGYLFCRGLDFTNSEQYANRRGGPRKHQIRRWDGMSQTWA
jgi:hypothetical protein